MTWTRVFSSGLEIYLNPPGQVPGLGPEHGRIVQEGISRFDNPYGSSRYVYFHDGRAIAALQVVKTAPREGVVANVFVDHEYRRQRLATKLFRRAQRDFHLEVSPHQSLAGAAWVRSLP